ncbi:hypothetical protein HDU77_006020 [Chytriomyces hyalinus]|nr:hypothetical protein HDU77_006020 [Chytriomyces hyalinus]
MKAFAVLVAAATFAPFVLAAESSDNYISCVDDSACGKDQCIHQESFKGRCQPVPTALNGNCINNSTCADGLSCVYDFTPVTVPSMLGNCWKKVYAPIDGECGDPIQGAYNRTLCDKGLKCIRSNPRDGEWKGLCKATDEGLAKLGEACDSVVQIDGYHCGKGLSCDGGKCKVAGSNATTSAVFSTAGIYDKKASGSVAVAGFFGLIAALWM